MLKGNKQLAGMQSRLGSLLALIPVSANGWTLISLVLAAAGFVLLAMSRDLAGALALFVLSFACDAIDGAVARARKEATAKGAFIDGMSDRFAEFLLAFGFLFYGIPPLYISGEAWLFLFLFLGACMTAFAKAYAGHTGAVANEMAKKMPGIFERAERAVLLLAGMAAALFWGDSLYITAAFSLASALSFITVLQRISFVLSTPRS